MKLYGKGKSRSFRCVWAAEEIGVDYDYIDVAFGSTENNGTASEAYRELNFQGKVPTLVDELENGHSLVLTESAAIVSYLALKHPERKLIPADSDLINRALYDQLAFFTMSDLEQPLWTNGKHRFAIPKEQRVKEVIKTTYWEFEKSQKALLKLIDGAQAYAMCDHFTMADILIAHTLSWGHSFEYELLPPLKSYMERMMARDACQRALEKVS